MFLSLCALAVLSSPADAAGKDTVVLLATNDPDQDESCTDFLAEALRARGVSVVDPSTVRLTYHQRAEAVAIAIGPVVAVSASSVSWIEETYNSSRALFANIRFQDSTSAYGDFTVYQLRATCSFRCMDVGTGAIVKAGTYTESRRGEDLATIQSQAANYAMLGLARAAAPALR